mmetsp:Transcript_14398/g.26518  ORF Transcript_14398/g.26518 Transcript_14398/m.26518 type:complete len:621 (-) Transcript_14398:125-1987(-)
MFHDTPLPAPLFAPMSVVPTSFEPNAISNSQIAQLQLVAAAVDMQTQAARVRAEVAAAVQWAHLKREVEHQLIAEQTSMAAQSLRRLPPGLCDSTPCERVPQKVLQLPPTAVLAAALEQHQPTMMTDGHARKPKQHPNDGKKAAAANQGKPRGGEQPGAKAGCHETMRSHLQALRNEDPRCIVITRRIGKLGFHSKDILNRFFQKFGQVRQVLVAHSKVKPFGDTESYPRQRPGNFGLVLMKDMETVQRILGEGPTLTVAGVEIQVQPFYRVEQGEDEIDGAGEDHLSERSMGVSENTSTTQSGGMSQPRQTSSSSCGSGSDEINSASAVPQAELSDEAPAAEEQQPSQVAQATDDAHLAQTLLELSHLTKETAFLAQWGQMRFKQLEEQCQQRAALLHQGRGAAGPQNRMIDALPVPVPAPMSFLQPVQPQQHPQWKEMNMPPAVAPDARKESGKSTKEKSNNQSSKTRMQMACFSESSPPVRDTLRGHLTQLASEDERCIFIARRINKLGFSSREILEQHFSKYGEVVRVLVAHSRVRNVREMDGQVWVRPGGLGLIVMKDAKIVQQILESGEEQTVGGHAVRVQAFQRPKGALESLDDGDLTLSADAPSACDIGDHL